MSLIGLIGGVYRFKNFIDNITPKVSFDTFVSAVNEAIDQDIITLRTQERMMFLGGKMRFSFPDDYKILMKVEMFFQTPVGDYEKIDKQGEYKVSMLKPEAYDFLLGMMDEYGETVIEIREP